MYRLKERQPVTAIEFVACHPETFISAFDEKPDALVVRAAVFCTMQKRPHILLVKRSETDTLPGRWEIPGGGIDSEDATVKDAVARELKEETGLTSAYLLQEVGHGIRFRNSRGKLLHCVTFIVEVDEIGTLEHQAAALPYNDKQENKLNGHNSGSTSYTTEQIPVRLNDQEHSRFIWATEEVVQAAEYEGEKLNYVSEEFKTTLLQAFELQKYIMEAKASI